MRKNKPASRIFRQHTLFRTTREDWHPSIDGHFVRIRASQLGDYIQVSVWGGDDTGMNRAGFESFDSAVVFAKKIPQPVTRKWLLKHGFNFI